MLAEGTKRALRESGYDVATAVDCDLLVLDLGAPGTDGEPAMAALRAQGVATPVLIVTAHAQPGEEARVGLLVRAGNGVRPVVLVLGPLEVDRERRIARYAGAYLDVSPRECELLAVLLETPGRAVERERIIAAMNHRGHYAAENAIEVCVHRLRRKLEPGAVRIVNVRGLGYYIALEPDTAANPKQTPDR